MSETLQGAPIALPTTIVTEASPAPIHAAGVMFVCKTETSKRALFLKRSNEGDHPGEWCFPGGKIEDGEDADAAAEREVREECGPLPYNRLIYLTRSVNSDVDFTTFVAQCKDQVIPKLNDEHVAFAWTPIDQPPEPLHPGCRIALARLTMDELGVAQAIAAGQITSPQKFENVWLFNIRITGTGTAYRKGLKEYVWRDPSLYLTDRFLQRCNGLAVIWIHPEKNLLNSDEYKERNVGSIFLPYIQDDEVWGIAKIYDEDAVEALVTKQLSTSPAVYFTDPGVNKKLTLEDGSKLLIEGDPKLLDHVALVEQGVWDKGGDPAGVETVTFGDSQVADTEAEMKAKADAEEKAKADKAKADADAGTKLDKVLSFVDSMSSRMDSMNSRMDAWDKEKADAQAKADADEKNEKEKADKSRKDGDPDPDADEKAKQAAADKAKKDADEKDEKEKVDASRADSIVATVLERVKPMLPQDVSDKMYAELGAAQADAAELAMAFGDSEPRPLQGEQPLAYRRRVLGIYKKHSKLWEGVDLSSLTDAVAFGIAEKQIRADAMTAAANPTDIPLGELRMVPKVDRDTGLRQNVFYGRHTIFRSLSRPSARVTRIGVPSAPV